MKDDPFDLFKISKSKDAVDLSPPTIREWARQGLRLYKVGKNCFASRSEVAEFIRNKAKVAA